MTHATAGGAIRATLPGHAQPKRYHRKPGDRRPQKSSFPTIELPGRPLVHGDLVPFAYAVARRAHDGQTDKAGREYLGHPTRIVSRLAPYQDNDSVLAVAWLHDVVEDSEVTLDDLRAVGFPDLVVKAVDAVTRRPQESYLDSYLRRVADNPTALLVKLADISDNSDPDRLSLLPDELAMRLMAKQEAALAALNRYCEHAILPIRRGGRTRKTA